MDLDVPLIIAQPVVTRIAQLLQRHRRQCELALGTREGQVVLPASLILHTAPIAAWGKVRCYYKILLGGVGTGES